MKRHLIYHTQIAVNESNNAAEFVCIKTENNAVIEASLQLISKDGLTITCNQHTLHKLLPNTPSVSPKQPVLLPVSFTLDKKIDSSCNVICIRRLSKDTFELEMTFKDMDEKSTELVDQYVEKLLIKKHRQQVKEPLPKVA